MNSKLREVDFFSNIKFENRTCPICNSSEFDLLFKGDRHKIGISNVICNNCNHIYINPSPDISSLNIFYKEYYRNLYNSSEYPDKLYLKEHHPLLIGTTRNVADILYIFDIINDSNKPKNIFDLGCSEGYFLNVFQRLDSNILRDGLELNSEFLNFGIKNKWVLNGYKDSIENFQFNIKYDIITSSHVIEHILDPILYLNKIKSGLNRNGLIFLEFPVGDRKTVGNYFHLAHVNHFTESSIRYLFNSVNLKIYLLDKNGSRGNIDGSYRVIAGFNELVIENYNIKNNEINYNVLRNEFKKFRYKQILLNTFLGSVLKKIKNIFFK